MRNDKRKGILAMLLAVSVLMMSFSAFAAEATDDTETSTTILLKNAWLYDANYEYEQLDVLVVDGIIEEIGEDIDESLADEVIDLDGYTLLPGIIDAHIHIATSNDEFSDEAISAWLLNGVTAVGDLGMLSTLSAEDYIEWINEENQSNDTAYVISAGKYIDVEGGYGSGPMADVVMGNIITTAEEAADAVTEAYELGYTIVKIGLNDSGDRMTSEMIIAIVERCEELGMTLFAHIGLSEHIEELLEYGVVNFAHTPSDTMSDELIEAMVEAGATMQTTLGETASEIMLDNLQRFYEAGGTIIASTDLMRSSDWSTDATIQVDEMTALLSIGMTMQEVIASVTINAAEVLGIDDTQGTIEVGKIANLIAVEGQLDETLEALTDVDFIMYYGEIIEDIE